MMVLLRIKKKKIGFNIVKDLNFVINFISFKGNLKENKKSSGINFIKLALKVSLLWRYSWGLVLD